MIKSIVRTGGAAAFLAAVCVLFLAGAFPEDAYAEHIDPVPYIDENGKIASANNYTFAGSSNTSWSGTVVVKNTVSINNTVILDGDTKLILCDGATLTVTVGNMTALDGSQNKLTVYGQERNSGKLILTSDQNNLMHLCLGDVDYTQIGGKVEIIQKGTGQAVGNTQNNSMEIKGGELDVNAPNGSGCINLSKLTISGGSVKINSKDQAITLNRNSTPGVIDISGGELYANSNGTDESFCVSAVGVKVTGGTVSVIGAKGGVYLSGGDFIVSGGNVMIKNEGAGLHGVQADRGVNISGGTVNIESEGENSDGIYIYAYMSELPVNITGGTVNIKTEGENSYGITARKDYGKVPVNITGGNVTISATGDNAKGIWDCDDITIDWTKGTDRINISSSYSEEGSRIFVGTFMTEDGALIDTTKEEVTIGNTTYYRYPRIEGKTLIPACIVSFFDGDTKISENAVPYGERIAKPSDPVRRYGFPWLVL